MSVAIPQFLKKIQFSGWTSTPTNFSYEPPLFRSIKNWPRLFYPSISRILRFTARYANSKYSGDGLTEENRKVGYNSTLLLRYYTWWKKHGSYIVYIFYLRVRQLLPPCNALTLAVSGSRHTVESFSLWALVPSVSHATGVLFSCILSEGGHPTNYLFSLRAGLTRHGQEFLKRFLSV
jgi:hypothetical protein